MANDAVTRTAVVPVGFDQADVFVDAAVGTLDLGSSEIDGVLLSEIG
jgi:hypothetical protein